MPPKFTHTFWTLLVIHSDRSLPLSLSLPMLSHSLSLPVSHKMASIEYSSFFYNGESSSSVKLRAQTQKDPSLNNEHACIQRQRERELGPLRS